MNDETQKPVSENDQAQGVGSTEANTTVHTPVEPSHEAQGVNPKSGMTKTFWVAGILVVVLAAIYAMSVFGFFDFKKLGVGGKDEGAAVAMVNGEEISSEEFQKQVEQTKAVFAAFGQSVEGNDEMTRELEKRVLDDMINSTLLLQKAIQAGITVSDADVNTQLEQTIEQVGGREAFESQLASINLTEEELRANIHDQLLVQEYLNQQTSIDEIVISEEEIRKVYDEQVAGSEGAPPYEEIRDSIEAQLTQQQTSVIIEAFVATLRAGADIEVLIEQEAAQDAANDASQDAMQDTSEQEGDMEAGSEATEAQ